jgi:hypothetical protein
MSAAASSPPRLRVVRNASAVVTVLSVAALATLMVSGAGSATKHTVTKRMKVMTHVAAPAAHAKGSSAQPAASPATALVPAAPLTSSGAISASGATPAVRAATAAAPVTLSATGTPAATGTTGSTTTTAPVANAIPLCPLPLASPAQQGGLQSLIGLSPLFGPFSSEAFAAAPLFQPLLQDFGPFLIAFANSYVTVEPSLAPLIAAVESFENTGFTAVSPLYGPYRSEFLAAETKLATALAPLVTTVASNVATSCFVDIEGMLAGAAPKS